MDAASSALLLQIPQCDWPACLLAFLAHCGAVDEAGIVY